MIICSALYYPGSLDNPESLVRDNRFYGGKAVETFSVWWQYVRKHYPDVPVVLFADTHSPIPTDPLLDALNLPRYETGSRIAYDLLQSGGLESRSTKLWVCKVSAHSGKYFWPMQRNLVEAIITAYRANESLLWIDADCYANTNVTPLVEGFDFCAASIEHHQQTAASVFTYISLKRLHALDSFGIDLPSFLTTMLNEGPTETRMHTLQEGGLYKLFCYGKTRDLGRDIELSHLSCYDRFMTFLKRNPLDTVEYRTLVDKLEKVKWEKMPGVERGFHDMLFPENALTT